MTVFSFEETQEEVTAAEAEELREAEDAAADEEIKRAREVALQLEAVALESPAIIKQAESAVQAFIDTLPGLTPAAIFIDTPQAYQNADEYCKTVKRLGKSAEEARDSIVRPFNSYVQGINANFAPIKERLTRIEHTFKSAMIDFRNREESKRVEEMRKQQEVARAEADRQRKAAEAQAQKEAEARVAAEKLRQDAEQAATEAERKKLLSAASRKDLSAENAGTKAAIGFDVARAVEAAPLNLQATNHFAVKGQAMKTTYKATITDKESFIQWCLLTGNIHYLDVNTAMLDKIVAATKGEQVFPGVTIATNQQLSVTAGRI